MAKDYYRHQIKNMKFGEQDLEVKFEKEDVITLDVTSNDPAQLERSGWRVTPTKPKVCNIDNSVIMALSMVCDIDSIIIIYNYIYKSHY